MFQSIPCFELGSAAIKSKPIVFCHLIKYHFLTHSLFKNMFYLVSFIPKGLPGGLLNGKLAKCLSSLTSRTVTVTSM